MTVSDEGVAILVCESDRDGDSISDSQVRGGADGRDQYFHMGVVEGMVVGVAKGVAVGVAKGVAVGVAVGVAKGDAHVQFHILIVVAQHVHKPAPCACDE